MDVTQVVQALAGAAEATKFTSPDCPSSILDCAQDIAAVMVEFGEASSEVASAAYSCGGADSACNQGLATSFAELASCVERSVVAAADCSWPPKSDYHASWCIVEVMDAVNGIEKAAQHIDASLQGCHLGEESRHSLLRIQSELREAFGWALPRVLQATRPLHGIA
jgi:hypothetical protein